MFTTRVVRQIEAAHHNGPPDSKCYTNHGHSWKVIVEIPVEDVVVVKSKYGWGVDFHEIKAIIDKYDHQDLNQFLHPPSAENLCKALYLDLLEKTGIRPNFVEVHEGSGNSIRYTEW